MTDPADLPLLAALKAALEAPGEHRLFRSGKLGGLFPSRSESHRTAAERALREGLLEVTRTERKGQVVFEWVRPLPAAARWVHARDSLPALLRDWQRLLGDAKTGLVAKMAELGDTLRTVNSLAEKVAAALRRAELEQTGKPAGWYGAVLDHLDARPGDCPLPELFTAARESDPELTLPAFQTGVRRLLDSRLIRLKPAGEVSEPEHAVVVGGQVLFLATRAAD